MKKTKLKVKNLIILITILLILIGGIVFIISLNNKKMATKKPTEPTTEQVTTLDQDPVVEDDNQIVDNSNEMISTEPTTIPEPTNQSTPEQTTTSKPATTKPTTTKKTTTKPTTSPKATKTTCNSSNQGWIAYIADWKKRNSTSMIFDTLDQAIAYGEYAKRNYGYGYWRSQEPQSFDGTYYEDSECKKGFYSVELYVPDLTCGANNEYKYKSFYLPATSKDNLIDVYTYVTLNIGYKCEDRKWFPN